MNRELKAQIILKYGSQSNFGQAIGEDETIISRVIHGRRVLDREKREKWADSLGCEQDELFKKNTR